MLPPYENSPAPPPTTARTENIIQSPHVTNLASIQLRRALLRGNFPSLDTKMKMGQTTHTQTHSHSQSNIAVKSAQWIFPRTLISAVPRLSAESITQQPRAHTLEQTLAHPPIIIRVLRVRDRRSATHTKKNRPPSAHVSRRRAERRGARASRKY